MSENKHRIPVIDWLISDYGSLSGKKEELKELILSNGIELRVDKYFGDNQYYNGWVDYGNFNKSHLTTDEIERHYQECPSHCRQVYKGIVYFCSHMVGGEVSGKLPAYPDGGYLDLLDERLSNEEKRDALLEIDKRAPRTCYYCDVNHTTSKRFSAAEQLLR